MHCCLCLTTCFVCITWHVPLSLLPLRSLDSVCWWWGRFRPGWSQPWGGGQDLVRDNQMLRVICFLWVEGGFGASRVGASGASMRPAGAMRVELPYWLIKCWVNALHCGWLWYLQFIRIRRH